MSHILKHYTYSELNVGHQASFEVKVTAELQQKFLEISGDISPLHTDSDFAKSKGFAGPVVYGMLTASFYSTLVGTYLPGAHCLFYESDIKFRQPVFIDDILLVTGTVTDKHDGFKRLSIKAVIRNQHGQTVSSATLKVGVTHE